MALTKVPASMQVGSVISKSSAYSATINDSSILCDAAGGAFTVTLPSAVGNSGKRYTVVKSDTSSNSVTVDANGSETIGATLTKILQKQHNFITIESDGANWLIIASKIFSEIRLDSHTGLGSTLTDVIRYTTTTTDKGGSEISKTQSAASGDSFTVNEPGQYNVVHRCRVDTGNVDFVITKNATAIPSTSAATVLVWHTQQTATRFIQASNTVWLDAGDVVRSHTQGGGTISGSMFQITKVA